MQNPANYRNQPPRQPMQHHQSVQQGGGQQQQSGPYNQNAHMRQPRPQMQARFAVPPYMPTALYSLPPGQVATIPIRGYQPGNFPQHPVQPTQPIISPPYYSIPYIQQGGAPQQQGPYYQTKPGVQYQQKRIQHVTPVSTVSYSQVHPQTHSHVQSITQPQPQQQHQPQQQIPVHQQAKPSQIQQQPQPHVQQHMSTQHYVSRVDTSAGRPVSGGIDQSQAQIHQVPVQGIGNKDTIKRPKKVLVFTNLNTGEKFNLGDTTPSEEGSTKEGKKFENDEKDNVSLENSHPQQQHQPQQQQQQPQQQTAVHQQANTAQTQQKTHNQPHVQQHISTQHYVPRVDSSAGRPVSGGIDQSQGQVHQVPVQGIGNKDTIRRPKKVLVFTNPNTGEKYNLGDTTPAEEGFSKHTEEKKGGVRETPEVSSAGLRRLVPEATAASSTRAVGGGQGGTEQGSLNSNLREISTPFPSSTDDSSFKIRVKSQFFNKISQANDAENKKQCEAQNEANQAPTKPSVRKYDRELLLRIRKATSGLKTKVDIPIAAIIKVENEKNNNLGLSFNVSKRTPMNHRLTQNQRGTILPGTMDENKKQAEDENEGKQAPTKPSIRKYDRELLLRIGRKTAGLKSKVDILVADVIKVRNGNHLEMSFNLSKRNTLPSASESVNQFVWQKKSDWDTVPSAKSSRVSQVKKSSEFSNRPVLEPTVESGGAPPPFNRPSSNNNNLPPTLAVEQQLQHQQQQQNQFSRFSSSSGSGGPGSGPGDCFNSQSTESSSSSSGINLMPGGGSMSTGGSSAPMIQSSQQHQSSPPPPSTPTQQPPTPSAPRVSPADLRETVLNIFEEYLSVQNSKDTLLWIQERFPDSHVLDFIDTLIREVAEMYREHQHRRAAKLVKMLIKQKYIQRDQALNTIAKGIIPDIPDIQVASPKVISYVAKFVLKLFADEGSLDWLMELSQPLKEDFEDIYVEFISTTLDLFKLKRNEQFVKSLWNNTKNKGGLLLL